MSVLAKFKLLPEVTAFLKGIPFPGFVGGKDFPGTGTALIATHDPGSGEKIADIHDMTAPDVDRAVDAANKAFPHWAALSQKDRGAILSRLADLVQARKNIIAQIEALEAGKIEAQAQGDVLEWLRGATHTLQRLGAAGIVEQGDPGGALALQPARQRALGPPECERGGGGGGEATGGPAASDKKEYKPTDSYHPTGNLVYNQEYFQKLENRLH